MRRATPLFLIASIVAGLLAGYAIRRTRAGAGRTTPELPAAASVAAALLRSEIRDLDRRMGALRDEEERLGQERRRLEEAASPRPKSPEELVQACYREALTGTCTAYTAVLQWIRDNPSNVAILLRLGAAVYREKDWDRAAKDMLKTYHLFLMNDFKEGGADRQKLTQYLLEVQAAETDPIVRGWMMSLLVHWKVPVPFEQRAELARTLRETRDPILRDGAFDLLVQDPGEFKDVIRESIRGATDPDTRSREILQAWDRRALPGSELRAFVRESMTSDSPHCMIENAEQWVPRYLNPFAPQDTVALFQQTLSKPLPPIYKATSLMVMGSVATVFPARTGRGEVAAFAAATEDKALKAFANRLLEMIDQGKTFDDIRRLSPFEFGIEGYNR